MEFKELQKLVYEEYKKNGFEEYFNKNKECGDIAEIGLITTEVGEALEEYRNKSSLFFIELADITIRVMNFCNRKNIDLESLILAKNKCNLAREKYHGKKVI